MQATEQLQAATAVTTNQNALATALACLHAEVGKANQAERAELLTAFIIVAIQMVRQIEPVDFIRAFLYRAVIELNKPRLVQFDFLK